MTIDLIDPASDFSIEPFDYAAHPGLCALEALEWPDLYAREAPPPPPQAPTPAEDSVLAEFDIRLQLECRRSFEAGRQQGLSEGLAADRDDAKQDRERIAAQFASLAESAAADRARYFAQIEPEAVRLALAITARILRREAQMDPLLLLGAVRVALGQLAAATRVRLRVPQSDLQLWTEALALLPNRDLNPEVVAGEAMRLGDCILETELGTADLGVRAQLSEIERGFFDRSSAQPSESAS